MTDCKVLLPYASPHATQSQPITSLSAIPITGSSLCSYFAHVRHQKDIIQKTRYG